MLAFPPSPARLLQQWSLGSGTRLPGFKLASPFASCVTLRPEINLFIPQFSHLPGRLIIVPTS